ncbi:Uma2 family endonuclease [Paenibacillus cremeus]|uniref:Uma2 family endonuclease n=1 Tax=Paenibacillus cremeus TaxID=2163881 RepID=A0A559K960_9BACL|nr:Uma2 family endonuclease [Paenibacillus cremeus]TVY08668.1 Uma2 family endonuclease [Paenibacillus cremeus]
MLYPLETDERFEVWQGKYIVMEPGSTDHEGIVMNLGGIVRDHVRRNKLGRVYGSNTAVYLHGDVTIKNFRSPDLTFVSTDRLDIVQTKGIYGAPDLVIEITSPGKKNLTRDTVEKFANYEEYGVQEYWIVNPFVEALEIYSLQNGKYVRVDASVVLPGIELSLDEVFE